MTYYEQKAKLAYELYQKGLPFQKVYAAVQKGDKFLVLKIPDKKFKYSLSGGGIDAGEDVETAIKRELMEEMNANVKFEKELGVIHYVHTWRYQGKEFDVNYDAHIVLVKFLSFAEKRKMGLDGEFDDKQVEIVEVSKDEMLKNVAEFASFGVKLDKEDSKPKRL